MPVGSRAAGSAGSAPRGGWHPVEWGCELVGTAVLLFGGLSAVCLTMGPGSPVRSWLPGVSGRLLLTGLLFGGTGSVMAVSPWGRRSGAHLNPVVTLAFWLQGKVHRHDLAGYVLAQLAGALVGTAAVVGLWGGTARAVRVGATAPGRGLGQLQAAGVEAAMTAALVLMILLMTSSTRTARWTPLGNLLLVAGLVSGSRKSRTGLNGKDRAGGDRGGERPLASGLRWLGTGSARARVAVRRSGSRVLVRQPAGRVGRRGR